MDEADADALVYRIEEYIPDALYEQYESFRDGILDWFIRIGLVGKGSKAPPKPSTSDSPRKLQALYWNTCSILRLTYLDVSAARDRHQTLIKELNHLNSDIRRSEESLNKMGKGFGPDAEWKKLDGTCIDKVHGE